MWPIFLVSRTAGCRMVKARIARVCLCLMVILVGRFVKEKPMGKPALFWRASKKTRFQELPGGSDAIATVH